MAGRPAGLSDSEESEDFDIDADMMCGVANEVSDCQQTWGNDDKGDGGDPWRQDWGGKAVSGAVPVAGMDLDTFRRCVEEGELGKIQQFFQSPEGQAQKAAYLNGGGGGSMAGGGVSWGGGAAAAAATCKPTFLAAENGRADVLRYLMSEGASTAPDPGTGDTVLMAVCAAAAMTRSFRGGGCGGRGSEKGDFEDALVECARLVIDSEDYSVNAAQSQGMTALMMAARQGRAKLVKLLVAEGRANMDAMDTQRWTALCFAVDRGWGHVARLLLDSGADPGIVTLDGQTVDLVPHSNKVLHEIVEAFVEVKAIRRKSAKSGAAAACDLDGYTKFTELQNVLLGVDATEYLGLFEEHGVNLEHFLSLSEQDLEQMGVHKVGVRKKIVQAIGEIHKRDWDKSSVPRVQPKDRRNGINFTCPEAVVMVANIDKHLAFINANLRYMRKNVASQPAVLRLGQDVANVDTLLTHVGKTKESLTATAQQLRALERTLAKFSSHPDYSCPDRIEQQGSSPSDSSKRLVSANGAKKALLLAYVVSVPFLAFRAYKFLVSF